MADALEQHVRKHRHRLNEQTENVIPKRPGADPYYLRILLEYSYHVLRKDQSYGRKHRKEDLAKQTGLTIVISLILGIIITVVDSGALRLIDWILTR